MKLRILFCFLVFILQGKLAAQSEFVVNSSRDSIQREPRIARDASGSFVVVWSSVDQASRSSKGDIYLQKYSSQAAPVGGEILVNTDVRGQQEQPAIAMNDRGDFVVAWASFSSLDSLYDVKVRFFPGGQPAGPEAVANSTIPFSQQRPAIALDSSGTSVLVWDSWNQDGSDRGIIGQRFSRNGQKLGSEFIVNSTKAYSQARPAIQCFRDGRFVVAWESWRQDGGSPEGYGVYARVYGANGSPLTDEIQVNTFTGDYQWMADVDVLNDSSFVVAWCSWGQDGAEGGIYYQRFTVGGVKLGTENRANTSTAYYQWLPKVRRTPAGSIAIVWSSWKQDGSREGVYARMFDREGRPTSFETQVNDYTPGFQWEPDVTALSDKEIVAVWSSWGQLGKEYDIVGKRIAFQQPQGVIPAMRVAHSAGRSSASIGLHVVDSTALTGHTYEVAFDSVTSGKAFARISDLTTAKTVVPSFPIDRGKNVLYLSPLFDGVRVQIVPEFDFELDTASSYFANHSGSSIMFRLTPPGAGIKLLAPIDIALIWGSTDTLSNGSYRAPLDTALSFTGARTVSVPFRAWNLTDRQKVDLLVVESSGRTNQRWDPGDRIIFLTPPPYRTLGNNTHAEFSSSEFFGGVRLPGVGDTLYVFTKRPLTTQDRYTFTASRSFVVNTERPPAIPYSFSLLQNFPNPFNPSTAIRYSVPARGRTVLKLWNVMGQQVRVIVDQLQDPGEHRVNFKSGDLASGVYFYTLQFGELMIARKMVLLK